MEDLANDYVNQLMEEESWKELLKLKEEIERKYKNLILRMKSAEEKYNDAKRYKEYLSNFDEIQKNFKDAKQELYSKQEVKRYFELEREIQKMLHDDFNEIKSSISNKFSLNSTIF